MSLTDTELQELRIRLEGAIKQVDLVRAHLASMSRILDETRKAFEPVTAELVEGARQRGGRKPRPDVQSASRPVQVHVFNRDPDESPKERRERRRNSVQERQAARDEARKAREVSKRGRENRQGS